MSLDFSIDGPVNRSLAEFENFTATFRLGDGTEVPLDKLTKTADQIVAYAKKTGKTADQVLTEVKAELARQKKAEGAPAA